MAVADDLFPSAPDVDEGDLVRWLSLVERAAHSRGFGRPAQLVRFEPVEGGAAVAFHPLPEGAHPEAALLGLTAPAGWPTLGVVADGGAVALDGDGAADRPVGHAGRTGTRSGSGPEIGAGPRSPDGGRARRSPTRGRRGTAPGRRARVAVMAARSGLVVSLVRVDGDEPFTSVHRPRHPRPAGRLVDLLLRALGQPTAPPPSSTVRLWAVVWLERALALAAGGPAPGWDVVAALHPALQIAGGGPPPAAGGPPPPPEGAPPAWRTGPDGVPSLVEVAAAAGRLVPWERLRAEAAAGRWPAPRLRPDEAAWMDAGAFARWVEGELPPLDALVRQATSVLPRPVGRGVTDAVASWGLDAR